MASIIPPASQVRAVVKSAIEKAEKERAKNIDGKVEVILSGIAVLIGNMQSEACLTTEYFVDNGDMNGPIEDDDLCKYGAVINKVCSSLSDAGYFTDVYEGKFKPMGRYGTYIKISLEPIPDEDY